MDPEVLAALDALASREVRHLLVRLDVLGSAVRIPAVVERVDADEDVLGLEDLRPREREGQEDGVSRGYVGDRDARNGPSLISRVALWDSRCSTSAPILRRGVSRCRRRCCATTIRVATRRAASISASWRCPYRKVIAKGEKPASFAMASVVVESRPPLKSTSRVLGRAVHRRSPPLAPNRRI